MRSLFAVLILGFLAAPVQASTRSMEEWLYRVADNPREALAEFQAGAPDLTDLHEASVNCFLLFYASPKPCSIEQMNELDHKLEASGLTKEQFFVKETRVKIYFNQGKLDEAKPLIEDLIAYATRIDNDDFLLRAYLVHGTYLQNASRQTEALSNFQKAVKVLERNRIKDPLNRHIALMEFAMSTPNMKVRSQGPREIYHDAVDFFESKRLRNYVMISHYNLAAMLLDEDNPASWPEIRQNFQRVAEIARELDNANHLAYALLGLSRVDFLQKNYGAAEARVKEALPVLEKAAPEWLLHAYTELAEIRKALGHNEEALEAIEKAETLAQNAPMIYQQNLREKKTEVLVKLHRYEAALNTYRQYHDQSVKDLQEKSKAEYNKMTVDLGLTVEEEKSRLLTKENQREKQLSSYKSIVLISATILIVVLGIGFFWVKIQHKKIQSLQHHIQETVLQRFFPPAIVQQVVAGSSPFDRPAEESTITVLFCDLVDFTHSSERLGAQNIALVLNEFFKEVTEEIFATGGTIDKFIGDAVMVLFGVPIHERPEIQAQKAFECAQRILACVQRLNRHWKQELGLEFAIRIGLHQGPAIVGAFGSQKRSDYTAIGLNVNIAARIEAKAMPNTVTMSAAMALHLPHLALRPLGPTSLRGVSQMVELFEYKAAENAAERPDTAA